MIGGPARNSAHKPLARMSKLSSFGSSHKQSALTEMHLYQILDPVNAENSKAWGSNLRLRNEMRLKSSLAKGYFDAPGTLTAPLGVAKNSDDITLPLVTTVFASVEHSKLLSSKEVRQVERGLLQSARSCLDQVQGDGYLCRVFGNLKLMLCFSKPEAALAWSCALQESMMAQTWPKAVLKDPFREGRDTRGHLIFRGPRLKIGISQGRPDSIQPDHLGRSDYHGDCVNRCVSAFLHRPGFELGTTWAHNFGSLVVHSTTGSGEDF
ncbi:hypothetical protein DUNSADRAFT_17324 [Dunaliella salina]|uniref:Guanylate cyclase domain-containing protein n=1 Tax=Dunaliella salina TaxID=3046 RepID=A0ABQ7G1Y9_DUNSA|nr:hypothetical protein DUNSADRAFT_17324 [Dunaliella salina]|eukprot:KAF5828611.1 hypothetical protein DUNSADRAFT_17324 [Dunaliella salina]